MKKESCINFVRHEELGKYPYEKSIKYTLKINNQNVPIYCYAHVFKGNIVSLELSRTPEKIRNMSSDIMLSFFAKVLGSLNKKEKSKITQVYTKLEYWEEENTKLSQIYFNTTLPFSASYYSVVLDKAHMVFSPCQTICPYTHAVFIGFINRIDIILGKG